MTSRRNLYFTAATLAGLILVIIFATRAQPAALTSELALRDGSLRQEGNRIEFTVETAGPVDPGSLTGLPDTTDGTSRYLCLELTAEQDPVGTRVCVASGNRVGMTPSGGKGERPVEKEARILASDGRLTVRFAYRALDLDSGRYRFRFVSSDGSCGPEPGKGCVDAIPSGPAAGFNLRVPALVGCENGGGRKVRHGSRETRAVALTFDDGPGLSTPDILEILRRKHVDATFFLLGSMISGNREATRQIARQGSEVANHSVAHAALPPLADIELASREIETVSGVRPCSFRPPYGDVDRALVGRAGKAGMDTVLWDVDTDDWQSSTTVDSILGQVRSDVRNGSIILMHDGGDQPRPKTIELLPRLIDQLRGEGYDLVTVSELLGNEITWEPLGRP